MLRVDSVGKQYGSQIILNDISFTINEGMVIGITGDYGAGKTTLIQILSSTIPPSSGRVVLNGIDMMTEKVKYSGRIACYHYGQSLLYQNMTVHDNLVFAGHLKDMTRDEIDERVILVSKQWGVDFFSHKKVSMLSKEEKLKTILAILILHNPSVLLLDDLIEKASPLEREMLFEYVKRAQENKRMVVITASKEEIVTPICDELIKLKRGAIHCQEKLARAADTTDQFSL